MVYLKELGRSIPTGLLIGSETRPKISIDKDLSTAQINYKHLLDQSVERMEVHVFFLLKQHGFKKHYNKFPSLEYAYDIVIP